MTKESFKVNAATELKERTAALNTQLRFGRERPALMHAYQLRAFLQLRGAKSDEEKQQLERVEQVIAGLEKRKTSGIQRLLKTIIETAIRSLTPDDDSEHTLLDQFTNPVKAAVADQEFAEPDQLLEAESDELEFVRAVHEVGESEEDGWGWGGETVSSTSDPPRSRQTSTSEETEEDYWGDTGGYTYNDKF